MKYTDKQIKLLLEAVYEGRITQGALPKDLYFSIADKLKNGLYKGFGGTLTSFEGKPLELLFELRENVYLFSGAKTFQTVSAVQSLIKDGDKIRPLKEFREVARQEYDLFNKYWARTEYDTAVASGQQASLWQKIEFDAETLPYLQMSVVEDANTTAICRPFNEITLPVAHPFWKKYYPPNHYNCRSTVLQLDEADVTKERNVKRAIKHAEDEGHIPEVFKMNVGLDKKVFSESHPYYDVPDKFKELARNNFNLPIPQKDA